MNIIFPLSVVYGIMVGFVFMYEFMHVCMNVRLFLYRPMYVGVHACMCVRLENNFINVKSETK